MERQRRIAARDSGGSFAGYEIFSCFLYPPPYGSWNYVCLGAAHRQHNDQVCSAATEWASGHTTDTGSSASKDGKPAPVASCSSASPARAGNAQSLTAMPKRKPSLMEHEPKLFSSLPASHTGGLWKYDPDIDPGITDRQWMRDCLFVRLIHRRNRAAPVQIGQGEAAGTVRCSASISPAALARPKKLRLWDSKFGRLGRR